jgi:hypothetical protein
MKSACNRAARLLGALENFASREAILLRVGDYAGFAAVRKRETPLIVRLCELGSGAETGPLMGRLQALLARRRENLSMLQKRTLFLSAERRRLAATKERLRMVSPYGRSSSLTPGIHEAARPGTTRLNAAV